MKITLIKAERITETDRWVTNPLGIMYLASVARQAGHEPTLLDFRVLQGKHAKSRLDAALGEDVAVVGFSAHSHHAAFARQLAHYVRKRLPNAFLVVGGPLATANTDYVLENLPVDACVIGEGETAFSNLLAALQAGDPWRGFPGFAYREGDRTVVNPPVAPIENLDSLPQPAWDLMDFDLYARTLSISLRLGKRACIHTSRGCPYECIYCQNYFGRRFRARSAPHVLAEIDLLYRKHGIRRLEIIDDCFNLEYERAATILRRIRDDYPDLRISFPNAVRGDLLDEPFVRLLKQARCDFMPMAAETGSPRLQKMIRKRLDVDKIRNAARLLDKYQIASFVCFMVGFPTETPEEIEQTFALARELPGVVPVFSMVTPYPRTALWDMVYPDGARLNPEDIDGAYGYRFDDDEGGRLLERALKITRRRFLRPRYWFAISSEFRWRFAVRWDVLLWKLVSIAAPLPLKRRLLRRLDRRFSLCLE
ncbi:MAG: radical SAM protein [Candidatus Lernaella stagnicola]|nr:radical SAM protein [Candidatus Lernaella stagnicola]